MKLCRIQGCQGSYSARGLCHKHYERWRKTGDPLTNTQADNSGPCSIPNCGKPAHCLTLCDMHYTRRRRHGDPLVTQQPERYMTVAQRFWAKVQKTDTCWLWTGAKLTTGHGRFVPIKGGRHWPAHVWSWTQAHGPVPARLELDHLCRNPPCVRPDHLDPVTHRVNCLRGESPAAINARKTHCIYGHEFSLANTYITKTGARSCRRCKADYQLQRKHRLSAHLA